MSCRKSRQSRASRQCVGSGQLSPPALALFAALPDVIVRADAAAAAVLAFAPSAVMLADARAPAVLALAPAPVMLVMMMMVIYCSFSETNRYTFQQGK